MKTSYHAILSSALAPVFVVLCSTIHSASAQTPNPLTGTWKTTCIARGVDTIEISSRESQTHFVRTHQSYEDDKCLAESFSMKLTAVSDSRLPAESESTLEDDLDFKLTKFEMSANSREIRTKFEQRKICQVKSWTENIYRDITACPDRPSSGLNNLRVHYKFEKTNLIISEGLSNEQAPTPLLPPKTYSR
jgi:hypothetical protein